MTNGMLPPRITVVAREEGWEMVGVVTNMYDITVLLTPVYAHFLHSLVEGIDAHNPNFHLC